LELLLELPWNEYSKDNFDLKEHKRYWIEIILVEEVKANDRASSCLKIRNDMKSPIICLTGPQSW
jgi:ATP-dependent Lon protease